ncbi:helix-turn-helix transcriptional regulator [uncultured Agrococcus sp.]|uniref:helix-turn-helix domain-containing protein n=1 Tax=uncultured Agrococcus sp. TaxID=382258 RepID=UPI0025EE1F5E|nr:helix-turn-helix transcriptional regulator [uncultured Agrococcus sp.]
MSSETGPDGLPEHRITVHLDRILERRGMTLTELSQRTGLTMANLSILKNGKAKAIRFTTLTLICDALECSPQDLINIAPA